MANNIDKNRVAKDLYYLQIAEQVLQRSTCLRRKYGAVIVNNDEIVSTGYNGAPRGEANCVDLGYCYREANNIPKGERYEACTSVHAEQNAIISASRKEMIGGTIYIVGREVSNGAYANPAPCLICRRMIVNAGIVRCVGLVNGVPTEISLAPPTPQREIFKCINKFPDTIGRYGKRGEMLYVLESNARRVSTVTRTELVKAVKSKKIEVQNITIDTLGRIYFNK